MSSLLMQPQLELDRCPHCRVARPSLFQVWSTRTSNHANSVHRQWTVYQCRTCGGLVTCGGPADSGMIVGEMYPSGASASGDIPERARTYLQQALDTVHAPAGSVMLAASAVDAMLKAKGKRDGSLYSRIASAAEEHMITPEMAQWAHEVRLDANDQRHSDEDSALPSEDDAKRAIGFAASLGDFLFVLPAKVASGRRAQGA
jgi:hypothetical protein